MSQSGRKEELLNRIESGFADVQRPVDDQLLHPKCRDDIDVYWLYEKGDCWQELIGSEVENETATLCFLSPEGYVWVLPAYMTYILQNLQRIESTVIEDTISTLCPVGEYKAFLESKYARFTVTQRQVVKEYLQFFRDFFPDLPYSESFEVGLNFWKREAA